MRAFKTGTFARFAVKERLSDQDLVDAVERANRGLIDANLGGGVIKQRIARLGQGRSGGYRTINLFRWEGLAFFVYGFAKNERENVGARELAAFRQLADEMLGYGVEQIERALTAGAVQEVELNEEDI